MPPIAFHGYHDLIGSRGMSTKYVSLVALSNLAVTLSPKNVRIVQATHEPNEHTITSSSTLRDFFSEMAW